MRKWTIALGTVVLEMIVTYTLVVAFLVYVCKITREPINV